ncbi:Protein goliath, partial [Cucurbita argyrosperma subsp. sororia]
MVFNKLFFFFYNNLIGFRTSPTLKQATPLPRSADSSLRPMTPDDCVAALSSPEKALEGETCCVCLSCMGNKDKDEGIGTSVLPCSHEFHKICLDRWFEECRRTCPICRYSMEGGGNNHEDGSNEMLTDEMVIWFSSFHTSGF